MAISTIRIKEIRKCVEEAIEGIRKMVELSFNKEGHHKSGRSGGHGKKFNIISSAITRQKNSGNYLAATGCYQNEEEKEVVMAEFEKKAKMFHNRAKSINHR